MYMNGYDVLLQAVCKSNVNMFNIVPYLSYFIVLKKCTSSTIDFRMIDSLLKCTTTLGLAKHV